MFVNSPNFNDVTKIGKKNVGSKFTRDVRGLVSYCFCPLEEKVVNKSCFTSIFKVQTVFTPITRPKKQAELLKFYFEPLIKSSNFHL